MMVGLPQSGGWRSFEAWKRCYLQEWGRVDPPPTQRPSVRLYGVYRVFSAPEGVQTEVMQVSFDTGRWPSLLYGDLAAAVGG